MNANRNDRVRVKGTISRDTAELMRRGELQSNNGLCKTSGRGSWYSEQPEFELDIEPTYEERLQQACRDEWADFLINDVFPLGRVLFRNEIAPLIMQRVHERRINRAKAKQIVEAEYVEELQAAPAMEEDEIDSPTCANVIDFSDYTAVSK